MSNQTAIQNDSGESLRLERVSTALSELRARYKQLEGEISVLITTDPEMKRLNTTFRGIDETTDVLSFPAPASASGQIGDIAISISFARRQAESRGVPIEDEIAMLAIHGGLHLAGFGDETPELHADMVRRMNEVAASCGVSTDLDWSSLPHGRSG
jgi:rRNA maturation RNase YbeY